MQEKFYKNTRISAGLFSTAQERYLRYNIRNGNNIKRAVSYKLIYNSIKQQIVKLIHE